MQIKMTKRGSLMLEWWDGCIAKSIIITEGKLVAAQYIIMSAIMAGLLVAWW